MCRALTTRLGVLLLAAAALVGQSPARAQYATQIDQNFNFGYVLEDRFAGAASSNYGAERIARLANGDVVVAGIVPIAYGSAGRNLGLVRYNQSGGRVAWSNPTAAYVSYLDRYITYPNNGVDNFIKIAGITVSGSRIYVQLDKAIGGDDYDSKIVAFTDGGQFIGEYGAFTTALREDGSGIVSYSFPLAPPTFGRRLIAVATYINGGGRRVITIKRFTIASDGSLSVDTSFGPYANGANDIPFPDLACQQLTQCSGIATDVAIAGADTNAPRIYLAAYNVLDGASDLRPAIVGIDGQTGNVLPDFGVSGVYFPSVVATSMFGAYPPRIAAQFVGTFDRVYVLWPAEPNGNGFFYVQRYYTGSPPGGSLALDTQFAFQGKFTLGCCFEAAGLAVEGDTVAVAGNVRTFIGSGPAMFDPFILTIFGTSDYYFLTHQALRADTGTRWGDLTWRDVVGAGNNDSSFIAAGQLDDDAAGTGNVQFGTLRYISQYDVVFADGFEL